MTNFKHILLYLIVLLCCVSSLQAKPNVILFLVDDMGWTDWQYSADLNPTGSVVYETPSMDRLARQGVVFSNAYAACSVCSPSRAAIMTGKTPARLRLTEWISGGGYTTADLQQPSDWVKNLPTGEQTLAEVLKAGGYLTAFIGKWHLGEYGNPAAEPLNNGFDSNIGGNHNGHPPDGYFAGTDGGWPLPGLTSGYASDAYLTDALTDHAVDFIGDHKNETFFLMMSHYAVHTPIQAPQSLINKYTAKIQTLQSQGVDLKGHTNATYAGMVESMDTSLGRLLDKLEDPDGNPGTSDSILENTIIVFTADNGGLIGVTQNQPLREGKGSLYEGGVREPFIVSWPGNAQIPQGVVDTQARISGHDIYPTLLELTGVGGDPTHNQNVDGVSFAAVLTGQSVDRSYQYWHYPHYSPQDYGSGTINGGHFVSSVRKDNWKLIWFYQEQRYELYNLSTDPGETVDVLDDNLAEANMLAQALHNYLDSVDAQMPINKNTGQPVDLPPASITIEEPQLKARYTFDDNDFSGTTLLDVSGNDNHAQIQGAGIVTGDSGVLEQAFRFPADAAVSRVDVPTGVAPSGSQARSFSSWFSQLGPGTGDQNKIFGYGSATAGESFDVGLEDGGIRIRHWGGNITYGTGYDFIGSDAGFHHLVIRVNDNASTFADVDVFLDNQLLSVTDQASNGTSQLINTTASVLSIGSGSMASSSGTYDFNGLIDDFRIYNYPLTDLEIAKLWAEVSGDPVCDPDAYRSEFDFTGPQGTPDCLVDIYDFMLFVDHWLDCGSYPDCL